MRIYEPREQSSRAEIYKLSSWSPSPNVRGSTNRLDPLVDAGLDQEERKRIFIPLGSDPAIAAGLRSQGWITIAALSANDDGRKLGCSHQLIGTEPQPY